MRRTSKILAVLLAAVMLSSCCGLIRPNRWVKVDEARSVGDIDPAAVSPGASATANAGVKASPKASVRPDYIIDIDEQVLYDANKIKITAKPQGRLNRYMPGLILLIENGSDKNITVMDSCAAVNSVMVNALLICEVAPGKKANERLYFDESELEAAGIKTIRDIDIVFSIDETDSLNTIATTKIIHIKTGAGATKDQPVDDSGFVALDRDGVRVVVKRLNTTVRYGYAELYVYIENNTSRSIGIYAKDVSVNGYMIETLFVCHLLPGTKAFDTIDFLDEDLKENDISKFESCEFAFEVSDARSMDKIFTSNTIKLAFD